jgi:sRNA-binding protein
MYRDHDVIIAKLAALFPKTFFPNPRQRVPLKTNIVADVERQGCQELIGADVSAAVDWYMGHIGYLMMLSAAAGKPRVDLNGKLVSKVTAQEARVAKQKVDEIHLQKLSFTANPMYRVMNQGTDLMKKVTIQQDVPTNHRAGLPSAELVAGVQKKLARVTSLLESEDDQFKADFLETVLKDISADVDALREQLK